MTDETKTPPPDEPKSEPEQPEQKPEEAEELPRTGTGG